MALVLATGTSCDMGNENSVQDAVPLPSMKPCFGLSTKKAAQLLYRASVKSREYLLL